MSKTTLAFIVILACGARSVATDIAFYVGAPNNTGWYDDVTQLQDVDTIIARTGHLFTDIQTFNDNQFGEFAAWMDAHTHDGKMDILWLNGCMPSVLYPYPNLQPEGSRIELFLDAGNMVINVADWFGYVSYEQGWWHGANLEWGAANILDLPAGIIRYADNTYLSVTPKGKEYLPSLEETVITYRPIVLSEVLPPWEVAAVFASSNGTDDPLTEWLADPVVIHNTETGAYVAFINQSGGGPATWIDRGNVCAEFIANWIMPGAQGKAAASNPRPADGATVDVNGVTVLSWSSGDGALYHEVYFGLDREEVEQANAQTAGVYRGVQTGTMYLLSNPLTVGQSGYWRIDEVDKAGHRHKGAVWSFTVSDLLVIDDFESYTDEAGSRIGETWSDGSINQTGSAADRRTNSAGDEHGTWSMLLAYDNTNSPFVSEVEREFVPEQNWTIGEVNTLSLWYRGEAASFSETAPGTFTMSAAGADIWSDKDQFRYACRRLDGDGAVVARIDTFLRTHEWAKAGVMIRESLDPGSVHAFMFVTPDGRRAFQNRSFGQTSYCLTAHSYPGAVSLPYWVKIERKGNQFTAYHSFNGVNWIRQPTNEDVTSYQSANPQTINMPARVYIGLALTSHASGTTTTATFSGVQMTGRATGPWQVADIGADHPGNSPTGLYMTVTDASGITGVLVNPNPAATNVTAWTQWRIPLSDLLLLGMDLSRVAKLGIGVGDFPLATATGDGRIYIDDIQVGANDEIPGLSWGQR